jgi:polyisoprenoid-binding protein YceI
LNAQSLSADVKKSNLKWHGKKVTGEHFGNISLKSGTLELSNGNISKGKFDIDMASITNTDLTDPGYNTKLVNHLKSDDFFGVANHPEAVIEIVKSSPFVNNEATVEAKLTIKNITHPVTFKVKRDGKAYTAGLAVDRSKYDVRYGSGSFFDNLGNNLIYDEFEISVRIETI